jgi:hypothetical protein
MTPLGKILAGCMATAIVVAATLFLRGGQEPAAAGHLTPSQLAEIQAPAKEEPRPAPLTVKPTFSADAGDQGEPEEPGIEDGSGS